MGHLPHLWLSGAVLLMAGLPCTHCQQPLRYGRRARGLCPACYGRWRQHGDPRYRYAAYAHRGPVVEAALPPVPCRACGETGWWATGYCSRACEISRELGA